MKNSLKIYKRDMKNIVKNKAALLMIIILIVLPCFYAWFNIKAAWDPYGNTGAIQVGIVNNDKGGNVSGKEFNVGDVIIDTLKDNKALGWNFISEKEAEYGLENGKYYATIVIPEDFTEKLLSITTNNIEKPKLIYSVNQKLNAIVPKITDKGITTIKSEIGSKIIKTIDGVIFKIANEIGIKVTNSKDEIRKIVDVIYEVDENMPQIQDLVDKAYNGSITISELVTKLNTIIPNVESGLSEAENILEKGNDYLAQFKDGIESISPSIEQGLNIASNIGNTVTSLVEPINPEQTSEDIRLSLSNSRERLENVYSNINSLTSFLESFNNEKLLNVISIFKSLGDSLSNTITLINNGITSIDNGEALSNNRLSEIKDSIINTTALINKANKDYPSIILPAINNGISDINLIISNGESIISKVEDSIPNIKSILGILGVIGEFGEDNISAIQEKLPELKEKLHELTSQIKNIDNGETFDKILNLLTLDWQNESSFLASPIEIDKEVLYPITNYGSEITPFYSALALWIGALLLVALTTVKARKFDDGTEFTGVEEFFGKYLTFLTIGIAQAIVLTLGDIYLLKIYNVEPLLFVLLGILISIVFVTIVYSLTAAIGNIGKAISLIFLVIQIAASGGLYPIQVMSEFFKRIYPFLPFKYAIGSMREAVAGITPELLTRDIKFLVIFFIIFISLGVLIRALLKNKGDFFEEKFKESGL